MSDSLGTPNPKRSFGEGEICCGNPCARELVSKDKRQATSTSRRRSRNRIAVLSAARQSVKR
jgi:hypothetical protein